MRIGLGMDIRNIFSLGVQMIVLKNCLSCAVQKT